MADAQADTTPDVDADAAPDACSDKGANVEPNGYADAQADTSLSRGTISPRCEGSGERRWHTFLLPRLPRKQVERRARRAVPVVPVWTLESRGGHCGAHMRAVRFW